MAWRDYFEPLSDLRKELGNAMLKTGLELLGLSGGPIRATGKQLSPTERRRVQRLLKQQGVL
jgi:hypothetical protein